MRVLNKKQKRLLTKWAKSQPLTNLTMDSLPYELYERLEAINDHETIHQNIGSFIWDLRMSGTYKKDIFN